MILGTRTDRFITSPSLVVSGQSIHLPEKGEGESGEKVGGESR